MIPRHHAAVYNTFNLQPHLISRPNLRILRAQVGDLLLDEPVERDGTGLFKREGEAIVKVAIPRSALAFGPSGLSQTLIRMKCQRLTRPRPVGERAS